MPNYINQLTADHFTQEFPGTEKPVRPGVYQRQDTSGKWDFSYFTGNVWRKHKSMSKDAIKNSDAVLRAANSKGNSSYNDRPWRGLTEEGYKFATT